MAMLASLVMAALSEPCTHANKQPALYLGYDFEPPLKQANAYDISAETIYNSTSDLVKQRKFGIYAAHPVGFIGTHASIGGYFGTQAIGSDGMIHLLFSIWDGKRAKGSTCGDFYDPSLAPNVTWCNSVHAFPASDKCSRHCNDCGLHPGWHNTTGTQCAGQKINVVDGEGVRTRIYRVAAGVTRTFDPNGITYTGSVWRAEVTVLGIDGQPKGEAQEIGTVFLEGIDGGLSRFGAFHEHIGCVPCSTFYESEIRRGPWIAGENAREVKQITFKPPANDCHLYRVDIDNMRKQAQFFSGPGVGPAV